jgi:hypothetical protein
LAEWRKLFNPTNDEWESTNYWNPNIEKAPESLDYWLDFISLPSYSVTNIGRRAIAKRDDKISSLWRGDIPPIIFYEWKDSEDALKKEAETGYVAFNISSSFRKNFSIGSIPSTALETIRSLILTHLSYNMTVSITCLPIYDLEVNKLIYIFNEKTGVNGSY